MCEPHTGLVSAVAHNVRALPDWLLDRDERLVPASAPESGPFAEVTRAQ